MNAFPLWLVYRYTRTKTPMAHVVAYRYTCAYDQTYDPVDCRCFPSSGSIYSLPIATSTKTFSTFTFSTCKIHTTKPARGEYNL